MRPILSKIHLIMRLLEYSDDGTFSLTKDLVGNDIPEYAILSHTWEDDAEELTFQDLRDGTGKNKSGYEKIRACGKQARRDGLRYFWVDTCCIDKTSSAELSEAINSMFQWYKRAKMCYAYLSDVLSGPGFATSRWFTRGWTLQELLAPKELTFYCRDWISIGSRKELSQVISMITGIGIEYLDGGDLQTASISQRMSWASKRVTTRGEDIAYCLLGIFGINMALLYGEGGIMAFYRLQEEIMRISDDHSIIAWHHELPALFHDGDYKFGVLAKSPADFKLCGDIVSCQIATVIHPFAITNIGIHIKLPLLKDVGGTFALLKCRQKDDFWNVIGIPIAKHNGIWYRRSFSRRLFPEKSWKTKPEQDIYLWGNQNRQSQDSIFNTSFHLTARPAFLFRSIPPEYYISDVYPSEYWEPSLNLIHATDIKYSSEPLIRLIMLGDGVQRRKYILIVRVTHHFMRGYYLEHFLAIAPRNCSLSKLFESWHTLQLNRSLPLLVGGRLTACVQSQKCFQTEKFVIDIITGSSLTINTKYLMGVFQQRRGMLLEYLTAAGTAGLILGELYWLRPSSPIQTDLAGVITFSVNGLFGIMIYLTVKMLFSS